LKEKEKQQIERPPREEKDVNNQVINTLNDDRIISKENEIAIASCHDVRRKWRNLKEEYARLKREFLSLKKTPIVPPTPIDKEGGGNVVNVVNVDGKRGEDGEGREKGKEEKGNVDGNVDTSSIPKQLFWSSER